MFEPKLEEKLVGYCFLVQIADDRFAIVARNRRGEYLGTVSYLLSLPEKDKNAADMEISASLATGESEQTLYLRRMR